MRTFLLFFCVLFATQASAADVIVELERNLADFTVAYSAYEREPNEQNQTVVARIEQFLTEQIFSVVNDEKLYSAAMASVDRRARASPAAIADLGMKLQIRWERDYLSAFYRTESQRRRLYQIPADAVLIMGGMMVGSRSVASPDVVAKYFNTMRSLWIGGSTAPLLGAVAVDMRIKNVPVPPAALITVAQLDGLDYRIRAAADAQHRKNIAGVIGILGGGAAASYGLGTVAQLGTKNPYGAAALIVFVLGSSAYLGVKAQDLSEWSFALMDEEQLEQEIGHAMYDLKQIETHKQPVQPRRFLQSTWKSMSKFEAARNFADAILKLQAHRDLKLLLAEMTLQDTLESIEAKYGPAQYPQKTNDIANAYLTYRAVVKGVIAGRGRPLLDPVTTGWLGRRWLKQTGLSPFVPSERATLKVVVDQWPSPMREYGIWWANSANDAPTWAAMGHDAALKLFHEMLDEESAKDSKAFKKRQDLTNILELPKRSDALFLYAADFVRSFQDPAIAYLGDVMESRATHYSELLLDIQKDLR